MRLRLVRTIGFASVLAGFVACADGGGPAEDARGLKLTVAPLNLAGIDYACYDFLVENAGAAYKAVGGGNDVLVKGNPLTTGGDAASGAICSNRYGNDGGGDIAYVATCDASLAADTGAATGVQNRVTIWVDGLYKAGVDISTDPNQAWQNPCPTGCSLDANCLENQDTLVEFNLTIMRSANQGFFDVAVNFEDVFCSAKVDCRYNSPTGQPIRLVHDEDGVRTLTAVAAVACTGGAAADDATDAERTQMYASDLEVDCGGTVTSFEVDGDGNYYRVGDTRPSPIAQVMIFRGLENLLDGTSADDADLMYWNAAVGFVEGATSTAEAPVIAGGACTLRWKVAVSKGPIEDVFAQANVTYPYLEMNVPITGVGGALTCTQHPANGGNGVSTVYTGLGNALPDEFVWHMHQVAGDAVVDAFGESGQGR